MTEETEKLDQLSKVLIATGAINYLFAQVYDVNKSMKIIVSKNPDQRKIFEESILQKEDVLFSTLKKLAEVMEGLGNILNAHDSICPIDDRATREAFEIIVHGKDNVE